MRNSKERVERILDKAKVERSRRKIKVTRFIALGCVAALILALNLTLFVPYTTGGYNLSKYKHSEYYELMNTIGDLTYSKYKTNNFREWNLGGKAKGSFAEAPGVDREPSQGAQSAPESSPPNGSSDPSTSAPTYEEVTNNQVNGVIEGDLFKRSNEYIWYLRYYDANWDYVIDENDIKHEIYRPNGFLLRTYSIAEKELVNEYYIGSEDGTNFVEIGAYKDNAEMFLSNDCSTITIFAMCRTTSTRMLYTEAINIDVSDPLSPKELGRKYVTGGYVSARSVNGSFLLVTTFNLGRRPDFSHEENFLPQMGELGDLHSFPMDDIYLPENATSARYTVIISMTGDLTLIDSAALFSYTSEIYVSENHLFAARKVTSSYTVREQYLDYGYITTDTEITCYSYAGGELNCKGTVKAKGEIVNQYSMDEYENVLRVFTTSQNRLSYYGTGYVTADGIYTTEGDLIDDVKDLMPVLNTSPECNLYCFDLNSFELLAKVENFSDPNESVKSVRFDGKKAYVCTAEVNFHYDFSGGYELFEPIITDPVFEFDLSDYSNITLKDTGTISGYSMSLIKFTNDTLLGIGYGDDFSTLKIELYRTEGASVIPVAKFEMYDVYFSSSFKTYFIDAEHGLIGLSVQTKTPTDSWRYDYHVEYLLLHYDGEKLNLIGQKQWEPINAYYYRDVDFMRACYIDGEVFLISEHYFDVLEIE